MSFRYVASQTRRGLRIAFMSLLIFQFSVGGFLVNRVQAQKAATVILTTPIKHVIVIIGENRSFDHVFATYVPKHGQTVVEPAFGRDRKRRRHSRPKFLQGGATRRFRQASDAFLLSPEKLSFANDSAGPARGRSQGLLRCG